MLSGALGGIATIRANGYIPYFQKKFYDAHDVHTLVFFAFIAASRWIGFRMDSIVVMFLTVISFLSVLVHNEGFGLMLIWSVLVRANFVVRTDLPVNHGFATQSPGVKSGLY